MINFFLSGTTKFHVFQASDSSDYAANLPKFVVISASTLASLLIYCTFGDYVTFQVNHPHSQFEKFKFNSMFNCFPYSQGLKVAQAAYDSNWYNLMATQKLFVHFMIMRAHKPLIFSGLHFFRCNLESYSSVILNFSKYN